MIDFKYEYLSEYCFMCGVIGHPTRVCLKKQEEMHGKLGVAERENLGKTFEGLETETNLRGKPIGYTAHRTYNSGNKFHERGWRSEGSWRSGSRNGSSINYGIIGGHGLGPSNKFDDTATSSSKLRCREKEIVGIPDRGERRSVACALVVEGGTNDRCVDNVPRLSEPEADNPDMISRVEHIIENMLELDLNMSLVLPSTDTTVERETIVDTMAVQDVVPSGMGVNEAQNDVNSYTSGPFQLMHYIEQSVHVPKSRKRGRPRKCVMPSPSCK